MPRNLQAIHLEEERYTAPTSDEQLVTGASAASLDQTPPQLASSSSWSPLEVQVHTEGGGEGATEPGENKRGSARQLGRPIMA